MLNNSFKHQQRKLSYSPVLKQSLAKRMHIILNLIARKRPGALDELSKVPHRRAHSKTDQYDDHNGGPPSYLLPTHHESMDSHKP